MIKTMEIGKSNLGIIGADKEINNKFSHIYKILILDKEVFDKMPKDSEIKKEIEEYLDDMTNIYCFIDIIDGKKNVKGFIYVQEKEIKMIYVAKDCRGQGIGALLVEYAMEVLDVKGVEVNVENLPAVEFYQYMGFRIYTRLEKDLTGNIYPIYRMKLL